MTTPAITAVVLGGLGLIVGSFLAVVSVRLPQGVDVVSRPSHCMSCERRLRPWELVPVFSWLALRARCARCGVRISARYPAVEAAAGLIGGWAGLAFGDWTMAAITAVLGWQLLLIAVIDAEHMLLPDVLTLPLIGTGLAASVLLGQGWHGVLSAGVGFAALWLVAWGYRLARGRDGLGDGDPFLFAGAGAWVGWQGLPSVLLWACALGFSLVAARLIVRRSASGSDRMPFGPGLALGIWLTWLIGPLGL